jgi:proteasome lid subunit RPN8/RPN11
MVQEEGPATIGRVLRRFPLLNAAESPREYLSDSKLLFQAFREMNSQGTELLAVYHSHPTSEAIPSRTDLERNYYPGVMQLIISLKGPDPVLRAWWLMEDHFEEAAWETRDSR